MFNEIDSSLFKGFKVDYGRCYQYDDKPVYFLLSRRGNAMEIHVKADGREGRILLRKGCAAVIEWIPRQFIWCRMLIAPVKEMSVYNLCKKLGFKDGGLIDYPPDKARMMVVTYG